MRLRLTINNENLGLTFLVFQPVRGLFRAAYDPLGESQSIDVALTQKLISCVDRADAAQPQLLCKRPCQVPKPLTATTSLW